MLKVSIIGLGNIGAKFDNLKNISRSHLDAVLKCNLNPIALIDKSNNNFNLIKKKFKIKKDIFNQPNKIKKKIYSDILVVSTSPVNRYKTIKNISNKIKSDFLIIEKPISTSLNDAKLLIRYLSKSKKKALVNYQRNWDKKTLTFLKKVKKKKIELINVIYSKGFLNNASHYLYEILKISGKINYKSLKIYSYTKTPYKNFSFFIKIGGIPVNFISSKFDKNKIEYQELSIHCNDSVFELKSGGVLKRETFMKKNEIYKGYNFLNTKSKNYHVGPLNSLVNLYKEVKQIILKKKKYDSKNLILSLEILKLNEALEKYAKNKKI